ncbi:hypothetical protein PNEG_00979 [Pneumocystis murina B123]|uniref:Kinetochore protein Spc24 n=1 Tax=Pneumocystis murina (strain B123) TaxID=1069680 RepID=M7NQ55_PNEMU|nr:hypothetical protein PNEG_00979 [Pneumocystis murina B123]EMR10833.1 hypothetical protein PNEG_00979 [Pneumocystis murina B123]
MPQELIQSTLSGFQIDLDLQSISRICERLDTISKNREIKQQNIKTISKNLERQLEISKSSIQAYENSPSRAEHASIILAMDRDKFSLAKNINELESSIHTLDTTYLRLKEELEELESEDIMKDNYEMTDDSTLLRLKIYRTLGIDLHEDEAGNYVKAIIRNKNNNDMHVVNIEPRYSSFFYSNYLWDLIST